MPTVNKGLILYSEVYAFMPYRSVGLGLRGKATLSIIAKVTATVKDNIFPWSGSCCQVGYITCHCLWNEEGD